MKTPRTRTIKACALGIFALGALLFVQPGEQAFARQGDSESAKDVDRKSRLIQVSVDAQRTSEQLIPRLNRPSGFDRTIERTDGSGVIAIELDGASLQFTDLPQDVRRKLVKRFGEDAGSRYERGLSLQLQNLVNRIRTTRPDSQIGVVGLPLVTPGEDPVSRNASYRNLIGSMDVLLPKTGRSLDAKTVAAAVSKLANGRQIVPVQMRPAWNPAITTRAPAQADSAASTSAVLSSCWNTVRWSLACPFTSPLPSLT